jgi:hypothetical protein
MSRQILDELGQRLMRELRDETISDWQMILNGQMKGERANRIREVTNDLNRESLESAIPEVVDSVIHHLLRWLEEDEEFRLSANVGVDSVSSVADESDGLSGELYTAQGWIAKYSEFNPPPA